MLKLISALGKYLLLMKDVFVKPDKVKYFFRQIMVEFQGLGVDSLGIVIIISFFIGAVVAIQTAYNIDSPLIPLTMVGFTVRQSIILEFSPTMISLILAGKVGSRIASEIGTMRVTEQIDALEIMGVNPANFLIQPKIFAAVIIFPAIIVFSMMFALFGGWLACITTGIVTSNDYIMGLRSWFEPYTLTYALIKTSVFAFIITSVSGFQGYQTRGGALEVGAASTKAVVYSSILIIVSNLILTKLLLA
ncbi:MAG: ABC transporter permease [Bacteroidetes bacterium 4484_276]|nr:MAG: ABC transporter permease [Bacteroidetes bacterium 4484_276]